MSQSDYTQVQAIWDTYLAQLNTHLAAIVTNNSGGAPGDTFAAMLWADNTAGPPWEYNVRSHDDASWATIFDTDGNVIAADGTFSGDVGIGTTPLTDLHIDMKAAATLNTLDGSLFLEAFVNTGAGNFGAGIIFGQASGGNAVKRGASIMAFQDTSTTSTAGLIFTIHSSIAGDPRAEAMRLDSNQDATFRGDVTLDVGSLGVGVTPLTDVHIDMKAPATVVTLAGSVFLQSFDNAGAGNFGAGIIFGRADGSVSPSSGGASIVGYQDTADVHAAGLIFHTHEAGIASSRIEAMRLDSSQAAIFTGDLYWTGDGSGVDFAEISAEDNATLTTIGSAGVKVQVTIFDTDGESNSAVPDHTNDHITITRAGRYVVMVSSTINSVAGAASRFEFTCQKNNGTAMIICHVDRNVGGGGVESGVISLSGIADLAVNDTIECWIENETNTQNYVVEDICLTLFMIGGT